MPTANEAYYGTYDQAVVSNPTGNALSNGNTGAEQSATNVQLGTVLAKTSVITDVSENIYIAPFIGDLYADASGSIGVLQQQTVTITGIDSIFDLTASEAQAKSLMRAFSVYEMNNAAVQSNFGVYDVSAHVLVGMSWTNEGTYEWPFKAALGEIIANSNLDSAQTNGHVSAETLYKYLKQEAHRDTVDLLSYDGLADLLEGSDLINFDIAVDASKGAESMWNKLLADNVGRNYYQNADSIAARRRRALFTQLPQSNISAYVTGTDGSGLALEHVTKLAFLPLLKGDTIVFVFDVTVGDYTMGSGTAPTDGATTSQRVVKDQQYTGISGELTDPSGGIVNDVALAGAAESDYSIGDLMFTVPTKRRVAMKVKIGGTAGETLSTVTLSEGEAYTDYSGAARTEYVLSLD